MQFFASAFLNTVFANELATGNFVHQDEGGWGKFQRLVILQHQFGALPDEFPDDIEHHVINDPHYWYAELVDTQTMEMLACKANPASSTSPRLG